jgi:hypothetical protein
MRRHGSPRPSVERRDLRMALAAIVLTRARTRSEPFPGPDGISAANTGSPRTTLLIIWLV